MTASARRILVVNAILRLSGATGPDQDRLVNLADLLRLGYDVRLLTLAGRGHEFDEARAIYADRGVAFTLLPYRYQRLSLARLIDPALLDGEAWTYAQPGVLRELRAILRDYQPDLVWCHTSGLWPIAQAARRAGVPTVIRSADYRPLHALYEHGYGLVNRARSALKTVGERRAMRWASALAAITPDEQSQYRALDLRTPVHVLPLRTLPTLLRPPRKASQRTPLKVFFMGSGLRGGHNRQALDTLIEQVIPLIRGAAPGKFEFHILGRKPPDEYRQQDVPDVVLDGYVDDLEAHLAAMDIAAVPVFTGTGMQQKVFEALCRGFPTVTTRQGMAGYSFEDGAEVLLADDPAAMAQQLLRLTDRGLRARLGEAASRKAASLFSQQAIDTLTQLIVTEACQRS